MDDKWGYPHFRKPPVAVLEVTDMEPGVFVIIIPQISVPAETFACCLFLQMI